METRSVWRTNRLAIIALIFGIVAVLTSPNFWGYLDKILVPVEPGARFSARTIWKMYRSIYFGGFIPGSNLVICWLVSLAGLITGIVSIDRERQKKWIAVLAIALGIYGILDHFLGFIMAIMP